MDILRDFRTGEIISPSWRVPDDGRQPDGLGRSSSQSLGSGDLVSAEEVVTHHSSGIDGDLPCPPAVVSASEGPPCKSSVSEARKVWAFQKEIALILSWLELHVPTLSAVHNPGVKNWQVDFSQPSTTDFGRVGSSPRGV